MRNIVEEFNTRCDLHTHDLAVVAQDADSSRVPDARREVEEAPTRQMLNPKTGNALYQIAGLSGRWRARWSRRRHRAVRQIMVDCRLCDIQGVLHDVSMFVSAAGRTVAVVGGIRDQENQPVPRG